MKARMHTAYLKIFLVRDEHGKEFTITSPTPLEAASTYARDFCKRAGWTFLGEDQRTMADGKEPRSRGDDWETESERGQKAGW